MANRETLGYLLSIINGIIHGMGWASFETYIWFMDKTTPLSSFFLADSWHSAGCGVLFFCTFEITSNLARKVSVSRLSVVGGSSRTGVKGPFLRAKIGFHAGVKTADHTPSPSHLGDITFLVIRTKSSESREDMREELFAWQA